MHFGRLREAEKLNNQHIYGNILHEELEYSVANNNKKNSVCVVTIFRWLRKITPWEVNVYRASRLI